MKSQRYAARCAAGCLIFIGLVSSNTTQAAPSPADRSAARALAEEGEAALQRNDYAIAADLFTRAEALVHAPTILLELAKAQMGLGKLVEAHENLQRVVREGVPAGSPKQWTKALEEANREADQLGKRIPWVTITVDGAEAPSVSIDDVPLAAAEVGVKRPVDPGSHTIRVTAQGAAPAEQKFTIAEGQTQDYPIHLMVLPRPASSAAFPLPPAPDTTRSTQTKRLAGFGLVGLGGAGIIAGTVTGIMAISKHSKLSKECVDGKLCGPDQQNDLNAYRTLGVVSTVSFIVGAAAGAGGVYLLLKNPSPQVTTGLAMSPFVGLGTAGIQGAF
jgi:hypothetical protein